MAVHHCYFKVLHNSITSMLLRMHHARISHKYNFKNITLESHPNHL